MIHKRSKSFFFVHFQFHIIFLSILYYYCNNFAAALKLEWYCRKNFIPLLHKYMIAFKSSSIFFQINLGTWGMITKIFYLRWAGNFIGNSLNLSSNQVYWNLGPNLVAPLMCAITQRGLSCCLLFKLRLIFPLIDSSFGTQ